MNILYFPTNRLPKRPKPTVDRSRKDSTTEFGDAKLENVEADGEVTVTVYLANGFYIVMSVEEAWRVAETVGAKRLNPLTRPGGGGE